MSFPGSPAPSAGPAVLRDRLPAHGVPARHGEGPADPRPPRDRLPAQAHVHDLKVHPYFFNKPYYRSAN